MAYAFNGNQWLNGNASPLGTGQLGDHSVTMWVNGASASGTTVFSISRSTETTGANNPSAFVQNFSGAAGYFLRGNSSPSGLGWNSSAGSSGVSGENSGGTAFDGTWHHVCCVLSGSTSTVYVDGSSVASYSAASVPTQTGMDRTGVGGIVRGTNLPSYNGSVAEIGVYSVALIASEIRSLSRGVACRLVRPQSLVFYAPLIRNLVDVRGGLSLTNNNAATVAVHPRVYA